MQGLARHLGSPRPLCSDQLTVKAPLPAAASDFPKPRRCRASPEKVWLEHDTLCPRLTSVANQWQHLPMQVLSIQQTKESTLVNFKH